jgi:hypothetical protein
LSDSDLASLALANSALERPRSDVPQSARAGEKATIVISRKLALTLSLLFCACTSQGSSSPGGSGGSDAGTGGGGRGGSGGRAATGGASAGGAGGTASGGSGSGGAGGAVTGGAGGAVTGGAGGGSDGPSSPDVRPADGPVVSAGSCAKFLGGGGAMSAWVSVDASGKLAYKTLGPEGDRIMDFSHAGYRGGGVALPVVPVVEMVGPSGGDDGAAIQAALDAAAKRPLAEGVRGAVLLKPGTFNLGTTLQLNASGVVLRGSGSGAGGTEIKLTGAPHDFIAVRGAGSWSVGPETTFTDAYVPAGATSFTVADASAFKPGDAILIRRPVTAAWVSFMGMDQLVRNGAPQTWLTTTTRLPADRVVTAVAGNKVTIDVPLSDSYDAKYVPGTTVGKYTYAGRISEVGLEHLRITAPVITGAISGALYSIGNVTAVLDGWISDVVALETENSLLLDQNVKRFTIQDLTIQRSMIADSSAGYPLEVQFNGTQILVLRTKVSGDNLYSYCTGARATGPNVVLYSTATGAHTRLEPHARWSTGMLADNVVHDDQLNLVNRGTAGSGHGWAIGWGVLWNSAAASINVQRPPGSMNWAIGTKGKQSGDGTFDSPGTPVTPGSLYLAQLCERLGPQAVANIGYK